MDEAPRLTHLDPAGNARMVDVTAKPWTRRVAVARSVVRSGVNTTQVFEERPEDLVQARITGIAAAKRAWDLIPLCHPIRLVDVRVEMTCVGTSVEIEARTEVEAPTGVEMEALTACGFAGLVVLMALRRHDPSASLSDIALWRKEGGRSGVWTRDPGAGLDFRLGPCREPATD